MSQTQENRVREGIAVLDREFPAWREKFKVSKLAVASLTDCPLGQAARTDPGWTLHEEKTSTAWGFGMHRVFGATLQSVAARHGFDLANNESYENLEKAWRKVLKEEGIA